MEAQSPQKVKELSLLCQKRFQLQRTAKKDRRRADINSSRLRSISVAPRAASGVSVTMGSPYYPIWMGGFVPAVNYNYNGFYFPPREMYPAPLLTPANFIPLVPQYPNTRPNIPTVRKYQIPLNDQVPRLIHNIAPTPVPIRVPAQWRDQARPRNSPGDKYSLSGKVLGRGSESIVYEGTEIRTGKKVAVKVLVAHYTDNEIRILKRLGSCENILQMLDYWMHKGKMYIVLELCDGNLQSIKQKASLQLRYQFFRQILRGMLHLDQYGVIHRDIKLHNILVKNSQVKLSDFGFAKHIGNRLEVESRQCGTPATMAPQVFFAKQKGRVMYDRKSQIWPLGVVLHQLVYHRHPFNYQTDRMQRGQRLKVKNPLPMIEGLLDRMLVSDAKLRISLQEVVEQFEEVIKREFQPTIKERNCPEEYSPTVPPCRNQAPKRHRVQVGLIPLPSLFNKCPDTTSVETRQTRRYPEPSLPVQGRKKLSIQRVVKFWILFLFSIYLLQLVIG